ncbi:porin family protein [Ferrimonas balearica]|uniref:porin family protein n=1 Tax=Ferrimonas balearica TaxID=44012 RepID=UPI001C99D9D0|nr:porin family protein [Ferrimonas balearica]MBY5993325.1 porin family protein [Ferrimonas balearica]
MKRTLLTLALGTALLAGPASANLDQGSPYFGGQLNYLDGDTGLGTVNPIGLTLLGGYQFNPYLGLEARLGFGVSDDSITFMETDIDLELDHYYAGYLVGTLPISDWVSVYGLLGFADAELTASALGQSESASENDFSYGLGLKLGGTENAAFTLEYVSLVEDLDSLNLGFTYRF